MSVTLSIVEDNTGFRESLMRMLNQAPGFKCLHAYASAEEAFKSFLAKYPKSANAHEAQYFLASK